MRTMPCALYAGTSSHPKSTLQKRKFKIKIIVLLHILIPGAMSSSLKTINPWLSACDLEEPTPPELQGTCSASPFAPRTMLQRDGEKFSCPASCPRNQSTSDSQCLAYLDETRRNAICNFSSGSGSEWLKNFLGQIRLRHCCEYKIIESLSSNLLDRVLAGKEECYQIIDSLVDVDNLAARVSCEFAQVLSRFDCRQTYSVRFSCADCKEAYRRWVCSSLVPFFDGTKRVRPCRSVCQIVEQKCPYFLPENRAPSLPTQYAGEPTFLCMDPKIPETGEQLKKSLYPEKDSCCVRPCGAPRDGLCIEKGTKCEEVTSYDNATADECNGTDSFVTRFSNDECPGPATYPSYKAFAMPGTISRPLLVALSVILSLQPNHHQLLSLLFFIFLYNYSVKLLACICLVFGSPSRLTRQVRHSYKFIKIPKLIFNYLKFYTIKWQYFFILISVNLVSGICSPRVRTPPRRFSVQYLLINRLSKVSEKIRGHYIKILTNVAQPLELVERRMICGLLNNEYSVFDYLVIEKITTDECGCSLNDNSFTYNRIKFYRLIILKIILIKILHCRLNYKSEKLDMKPWKLLNKNYIELDNCISFNIRLLASMNNQDIRSNVDNKSTQICMFLNSLTPYKPCRIILKIITFTNIKRMLNNDHIRIISYSSVNDEYILSNIDCSSGII